MKKKKSICRNIIQKYINITDIVRILHADYQQNRSFIIYLKFEQVSCTVASFLIKFCQFLYIPFNPVHHYRFLRTDDDDLSFIFHLFHHFQLFIVNCTPTTQCLTQLRIFPVDKGWNTDIFRVFPVTAITGKYNHITGVTVRNSSLQGNRVYNASITRLLSRFSSK